MLGESILVRFPEISIFGSNPIRTFSPVLIIVELLNWYLNVRNYIVNKNFILNNRSKSSRFCDIIDSFLKVRFFGENIELFPFISQTMNNIWWSTSLWVLLNVEMIPSTILILLDLMTYVNNFTKVLEKSVKML